MQTSASPPLISQWTFTDNTTSIFDDIPRSVRDSFIKQFPESILSFLIKLGTHLDPMSEKVFESWTFDLATAALICYTRLLCEKVHVTNGVLGEQLALESAFITRIFLDNTPTKKQYPSNIEALCVKAHNTYFNKFLEYGISKKEFMSLFGMFPQPGHKSSEMELGIDGKWYKKNN